MHYTAELFLQHQCGVMVVQRYSNPVVGVRVCVAVCGGAVCELMLEQREHTVLM